MPKMNQIGTHRTTVSSDSNTRIIVTYHSTPVVRVMIDGSIILKANGYETVATKTRMNQASNQYSLGYRVWQKNYQWYVDYKGRTLEFYDGITLKGEQ